MLASDPPMIPNFRLEIRDPKTNALLWGFTEHVQWAILQGNRNKNFDQASARIVADVWPCRTLGWPTRPMQSLNPGCRVR